MTQEKREKIVVKKGGIMSIATTDLDTVQQEDIEMLAVRYCLRESAVKEWVEKYKPKFSEIVRAGGDAVIECVLSDRPINDIFTDAGA